MPREAAVDPAIFDAALLAGVQRLIPPQRVQAYLVELDRQFRAVLASAANDPDLQNQAHKIVSQAGMLGLTRMSECAGALEDAHRSGRNPSEALLDCRAAAQDIELYAMPATA